MHTKQPNKDFCYFLVEKARFPKINIRFRHFVNCFNETEDNREEFWIFPRENTLKHHKILYKVKFLVPVENEYSNMTLKHRIHFKFACIVVNLEIHTSNFFITSDWAVYLEFICLFNRFFFSNSDIFFKFLRGSVFHGQEIVRDASFDVNYCIQPIIVI